jgi:tetratricopeptide (TPR) repeat protein
LLNAIECDKYDNMPDAKGKVKPKFHEANMTRVGNARIQLVNAGQREAQLVSDEGVLKYWGTFLDTEDCEFLKGYDKTGEAGFLGQVAYFTALYANQNKQVDRALKYIDIAMKDPEQAKEAQAQKFAIGQANLKTKEDTVKFINELKEFYAANPDNEAAFGTLCNLYSGQNDNEAVKTLVNEKISRDPNNHTAWALKGQFEMNAQDYDNAIESFKKACEIDDTNPVVLTYLGFCMNSKAAAIEGDIPAQKALYKESMRYLERAKDIDPDRMKANWAYPLYQCYYINYSANDPRTKELEEILK